MVAVPIPCFSLFRLAVQATKQKNSLEKRAYLALQGVLISAKFPVFFPESREDVSHVTASTAK